MTYYQHFWLCLKASSTHENRVENQSNSIKHEYSSVSDFTERKEEFHTYINESMSINDSESYYIQVAIVNLPQV